MAQRIEHWPLDKLRPYEKNPRRHSDAQVAQIAASIQAFGFNSPVLVDTNAGVIAGHGRLLAAKKLGLSAVPIIVLDHLSEAQKRAYVIADNRLAETAEWDDDLLRAELASLDSSDINLETLGFSSDELRVLFAHDEAPVDAGDDVIPDAPANPVARAGDCWAIGDHRLLCGDCRATGALERLLGGKRANLAFTSPPYATQRDYDPTSGFLPVPPDEYVAWFETVAAGVQSDRKR